MEMLNFIIQYSTLLEGTEMKFLSKFILGILTVLIVCIMTTACHSTDQEISTKKQNDDVQESTSQVTEIEDDSNGVDEENEEEIDSLEAFNEIIILDTANTDAYIYPIRAGTPEWKALGSYQKRIEACQLPESILKNMSTEGLVITVLNYPLYSDMFAFDNPQGSFEAFVRRFNGLKELLQRDDAGIELLNRYKTMDPLDVEEDWIGVHHAYYTWTFSNIEILLCQDDILDNLNNRQIEDVIKEAKKKYEAKEQSEIFPNYELPASARVIGKALQHAGFEPFISQMHQNENLEKFLTTGIFYYCDDSLILSSMEQFLTR